MPCSADMQARRVHHHEHRRQAACGSPISQPVAPSKRITQVGLPCRPIFSSMRSQRTALRVPSGRILGTSDSDRPLGPGRRVGQPRQHQVDDVLRQVVLAAGDEDLAAGDAQAAVGLRHGARAHQAQVAAGMRLGQAHRRQPLAAGDLPR